MVVAGQGEDKNVTNAIVELKEVGINLGRTNPSVDEIREGVTKVLGDAKYKRNVVAMSKNFERYDMGLVFDKVIQGVIRDWLKQKRQRKVSHEGQTLAA
jgi:UDP:flavonoid glycosyltransferase YjiC (YdhE family)